MSGLTLNSVGFVGSLSGPAVVAAGGPAFDPTVFAAAYLTWMGANTSAVWQDVSGKGLHLKSISGGADVFPFTANVRNGKPAYVATSAQSGNFFVLPAINGTATDYTITVAFDITTPAQFTALRLGDTALAYGLTYLGINTGDIQAIYQNAGSGATIPTAAGDMLLLTYQLNSTTGATIRRNRVVVQTGVGYVAARLQGGDAFHNRNGNIIGSIYALLISVGNQSAAQIDAAEAYITQQLAL